MGLKDALFLRIIGLSNYRIIESSNFRDFESSARWLVDLLTRSLVDFLSVGDFGFGGNGRGLGFRGGVGLRGVEAQQDFAQFQAQVLKRAFLVFALQVALPNGD